jgi:hypothetical protein
MSAEVVSGKSRTYTADSTGMVPALRAALRALPLAHIRLTIEHRYEFGPERDRVGASLVNPQSWDAIRESSGPFGLPATRVEWEQAATKSDFAERAAVIAAVADELGARRVCSYGVGAAFVELELARLRPDLELVCTDFTSRTLERLRGLFPEAEVQQHDLLAEPPLEAGLHLFHRIDSELSNRQWRAVIARFEEPILLVATELLELDALRRELRLRSSSTATDAGYIRTEAGLRSLWRRTHRDRKLAVASHTGFLLTRR